MKHILHYPTLKQYGFLWAQKLDDGTVTSYVIPDTFHHDMFIYRPISLIAIPSDRGGCIWHMSVLKEKDEKTWTLFEGRIYSRKNLKQILRSTLVFKKSRKKLK